MKANILLILMGTIIFLQGCATTPTTKMEAVASLDQKTAYDGTIASQKRHFVSLAPYTKLNDAITKIKIAEDKMLFMMTVQNGGEDPINIGHDNLSVVFEDVSKDQASNMDIQSFGNFIEDFNKEYNDNEKEYIYYELYEVWWLTDIGGMDEETALDHMMDLKYNIESMRRQYEVFQEMLPRFILKEQSIEPGDSYTGNVICSTQEPVTEIEGKIRVIVSIDGEEHRFTFNRILSR